jgi:protease I
MKRALIITGNLVQDHEFIYPYYRLKEENFEVITALKDAQPCLGILGTNIPSDKDAKIISYEEMKVEDYDFLVLPGGAKSMEKLRQEKTVLNFINEWNSQGKTLACICHGAQLLISANIVRGRDLSGYYSIKDDIVNAGANYIDAPFVISDNIITCPHYKYLGQWMNQAIKIYKENDQEY